MFHIFGFKLPPLCLYCTTVGQVLQGVKEEDLHKDNIQIDPNDCENTKDSKTSISNMKYDKQYIPKE